MYPRGNFLSVTKGNSRRSKPTDESIGGFVGFEVFGIGYDFTSAEFDPIIRLLWLKKLPLMIIKPVIFDNISSICLKKFLLTLDVLISMNIPLGGEQPVSDSGDLSFSSILSPC